MNFINFDTRIFCPLINDIKLYYQFNVVKWFLCGFFFAKMNYLLAHTLIPLVKIKQYELNLPYCQTKKIGRLF
jgi:hypothetical protein